MKITVTPSRTIAGFTAGKQYHAEIVQDSWNQSLLLTHNDNGHDRFISRDSNGQKSAHLWDTVHWNEAGHFIIVETT